MKKENKFCNSNCPYYKDMPEFVFNCDVQKCPVLEKIKEKKESEK